MNAAGASRAGDLAGWYSNDGDQASSKEILQRTFEHAKVLLRSMIDPKDFDKLFPPTPKTQGQPVSAHSISDIQQCLQDAQISYECRVQHADDSFRNIAPIVTGFGQPSTTTLFNKSKVKARLWLVGLSEKLMYYGNIFDVMAQHHPEYVSLAWGTFKLVFIAITNHAETASKLSKSISQIADLLPQHSLHLIMYPTPQMQTCVARLYSHIMNFFLSSLKWYEDSRATHAIKSIFQPWDLKFRPEYEAIAAEALQIRRLADVAMKAELRDTRLEVQQGTRHWELVQQEMSELRMENQRLNSYLQATFKSLENSMLSMYQELRIDFTAQRSTLSRVHLNQMLSLPLWNSLPTSGESLEFCRSMRNRNREYTRLPLPDVTKLETWASQRSNDVLLIGTYMPVIAKTFMVDLIDLVLDSGMPIVWALRYADYWDQKISPVDVIRGLVLQTMQIGADRLLEGSFPVTVEQLHEAGSLRDWVAILKRLLLSIGHAFVVLDADLLSHATSHERSLSLEMLETLRTILSGNVKIVISRSSVSRAYAEELEHANACVMIQTDRAKDLRKVRRTRRQRGRFRRW